MGKSGNFSYKNQQISLTVFFALQNKTIKWGGLRVDDEDYKKLL